MLIVFVEGSANVASGLCNPSAKWPVGIRLGDQLLGGQPTQMSALQVADETIGHKRPFYTSCVGTQSFAADAIREHKITPVVTSRRGLHPEEPPQLDGAPEVADGDPAEQNVEMGQ